MRIEYEGFLDIIDTIPQGNFLDSNYIQTLTKFLNLSSNLEKILNYAHNFCDEMEDQVLSAENLNSSNTQNITNEREYFMNKKLLISKFYSETVLKFLLFDIKVIIKKITRNK